MSGDTDLNAKLVEEALELDSEFRVSFRAQWRDNGDDAICDLKAASFPTYDLAFHHGRAAVAHMEVDPLYADRRLGFEIARTYWRS